MDYVTTVSMSGRSIYGSIHRSHRARAIADFNSRILQIPISQRKSIIVPISLHRRKTNATSLNIDNFELKKK